MKKLLMALLLTFILSFTYSCSDTAGTPSGGEPDTKPPEIVDPEPEPEPEPDPDDEIIETGKEWENIEFLDNVPLPAPTGVTIVDTIKSSEEFQQIEVIVNTFTYANFKTYITDLKASGALYEDKTHSKIVHILGGETALLPDVIGESKTAYYVFDYGTHYATITYYDDTYISKTKSTETPNLSIKLTKIDPFSNIGGKVQVMVNVLWADLKFEEGAELPLLDDTTTVDLVIYDNATDKQEMYIDIKSMADKQYKSYLGVIRGDVKFTRHKAIPSSAATGIGTYLKNGKSATWVVTDELNRYISIAYIGNSSPVYTDTNFKITINSYDPFKKGSGIGESNLSIADAIAKLSPINTVPIPPFISSTGKVVTFTDTKYGKEIWFEVEDSKYGTFRNYIGNPEFLNPHGTDGLMANSFRDKTHQKVPLEKVITSIAFGIAIPTEYDDSLTAAWSFQDGNNTAGVKEYISFIWHGKLSPNNPDPESGKAIFIIERMTFDPMWFLP